MKNLLFCLNYNIIDDRPYSIRALTIAKIYRDLGYRVIFLCVDNNIKMQGHTKEHYCDFECHILHFYKTRNPLKIFKTQRYFKKLFNEATTEIETQVGKMDVVVSMVHYALMEKYSSRYARKHHIPLIYTTSEWYQYHSFYGRFVWLKYLCALYMRNIKLRHKNVIVITRYLSDFYTKKHCHIVRIPSIVDKNDYPTTISSHTQLDQIRIMYAGYPGKKDVLKSFLLAIHRSRPEDQKRLSFYGYGFEEKDVLAMGLTKEEIHQSGSIHICGQVSQQEVRSALAKSDFSILLRENTLNAKGGFSTKIVESMMAGVPLIANLTGDMELYFHDQNSIILSAPTLEECQEALKKVLSMSPDEMKKMKQNAYQTAIDSFDYRHYLEEMKQFMEDLK